ncbi:MAG TPA: DUF2378 family protein [Myxococcus sp.]|nr:DUF2378 family protein [Myxococcus sp.]
MRRQDAVDWTRDLELRLAEATPDKMCRGMFLKGILQVVRSLGDEAALRRCMDASGESRLTDFFNYPGASQLRLVYAAAEVLGARNGGFEEGLRLLGRQATSDFLNSLAGKTMLALTGKNPTKMLNSLPTAYRASNTYGQHRVEWTGPTQGLFVIKGDLMPEPYNCGIVEAVLMIADLREPKVVGRQLALLDCECAFSWEV